MSNRGVNKAIIVGNVGNDPDVRNLQDGTVVANFNVATSRRWKDRNTEEQREETQWHRCVAWRRLGEIVEEHVHKGTQVYVEGHLQTRKYETRDGEERRTTEIVVNELRLLGGRPRDDGGREEDRGESRRRTRGRDDDGGEERRGGRRREREERRPAREASREDSDFDDDEIPF